MARGCQHQRHKEILYGKTKRRVLRKVETPIKANRKPGPLFYDVADEWWQEHEQKIAYYTARSYKPAKIRAQEAFKNVRIKDILPNQISREIKLFAKTYADKTVRAPQLMVYNLIFKYAVEMGLYPDESGARLVSTGQPTQRKGFQRLRLMTLNA